ncbi:hypothetical protein MKX03_011442 [Papaver bracteatum]|nr:hypothetical protein MKX03_011442 [Papaver bracteatum]
MSSGFIHFSHLKLVKASETIHLSGLQNMTLSENAKLRRKKHAKQNWKNKVERRKLEAKGQTTANVEEISPEFGQGLDDVDFSIVKIRQEKIDSSREEQEKLKVELFHILIDLCLKFQLQRTS